MRYGGLRYALLLACLLTTPGRAAEGEAREGRRWTDEAGRCSVELPAGWEVERVERDGDEEDVDWLLELNGRRTAEEPSWRVRVWHMTAVHTVRCEFHSLRAWLAGWGEEIEVRTLAEPRLHAHAVLSDTREPWAAIAAVVERAGVNWVVVLECRDSQWDALRDDYFRIVDSLRAPGVPEAGTVPGGYRTRRRGRMTWAWPETVSSHELTSLVALFEEVRRHHERLYGRPRGKPGRLALTLVHGSEREAEAVDSGGGEHATPYWICVDTARAFALPVPEDDRSAKARAISLFGQVLHLQRFGTSEPAWMWQGDGLILLSWIHSGERPPALVHSMFEDLPATPLPLATLSDRDAVRDREHPARDALAWMMFFHAGPRRYRRAFHRFREEFLETGDWRTAMETHLLALDGEETAADLRGFLDHGIDVVH